MLIASIVLYVVAGLLEAVIDTGALGEGYLLLSGIINAAGTVCFLAFFVMLAQFLEFDEITERATKVLQLYISIELAALLMGLPLIGCFLAIYFLAAAIYTLILYIGLLIDLNNALTYRISEQSG